MTTNFRLLLDNDQHTKKEFYAAANVLNCGDSVDLFYVTGVSICSLLKFTKNVH